MTTEYQSKNLDHLGIVSQICDDIGLVKMIDQLIPSDPSMKISHGETVKLMVINGPRVHIKTFISRSLRFSHQDL